MTAPTHLRVHGLVKRFGAATILDGIDLTVPRGQAVALIGSNGAGKSTLLRCCLRLVEPDDGTVELLGTDMLRLKGRRLRALRARVGFVFQKHNLVGRMSALSNVVHGAQAGDGDPRCWWQATAPAAVREEAMACLERVGLAHVAKQPASSLSGGQSQRVAIARALMQRPEFVVADEPVASLDPVAGEAVMNLFVDLMRRDGITLLYTSHNLHHALSYADRVIALRSGRIELDAASRSLDAESLNRIYQ